MKKTIHKLALFSAFTLFLFSCKSDDDTQINVEDSNYALVTRVDDGSGNTNSYYIQSLTDLDENTSYDNQEAIELFASGNAGVFENNGSVFLNEYVNTQSVTKWTPNESGTFIEDGDITVSEVGFQGNICFKDETTAFVGGPSASKIVIFNPTTMVKTGYIDFSSFSRLGEVTDYPTTGNTINVESPTEMFIRDGKLYVTFMLLVDFAYTPAISSADVLVIDLDLVDTTSTDNSDAILKWISDDRGVGLGAWNSGSGAKFIIEDENNDIYLLCHNIWGQYGSLTGKPSCILRIKDGETDFDPDYYFDLETAAIGLGNAVMNLEYAGNGLFFGAAINNSAIDPDNPYSYYVDPISQWYRFNLYDQTAKIVSYELTKGSWVAKTYLDDDTIYIPYQTTTASFVKKVDVNTLDSSIQFTTTGAPILVKIN